MSDETSRVVVGVDGSPSSEQALAVALEEARLRDALLEVVHVYPTLPLVGNTGPELRAQGEAAARATLDEILARAPSTEGVRVAARVIGGNPAEVLIEESRDAVLLVVGTRGLGGFRALVLGSVSNQCVHHAHCSVVVVRGATA